MNTQLQQSADEAIFSLQFNTRDAVNYVIRNARVDRDAAVAAVRQAMTFHRR